MPWGLSLFTQVFDFAYGFGAGKQNAGVYPIAEQIKSENTH